MEDAERQLRIAHFVKILFRVAATSGRVLENMRIFLGISDSAVRHGHVASALALAYALQQINAVNEEGECKVWPVVGMGSPPFRGGLNNPHLVQAEALQYSGYRTATIQSAVRYDVSYTEFLRVREILSAQLPPRRVEIGEEWVKAASRMYRDAVTGYLQKIAEISASIPSTRESELEAVWKGRGRRSTSAEGHSVYSRVVLRGPAPTLLDARFIMWAYKTDLLDAVLKALPALVDEWKYDSSFYCRERAEKLLGDNLTKEVDAALDVMDIKPGPDETYVALLRNADAQAHALALGRMRGFLG